MPPQRENSDNIYTTVSLKRWHSQTDWRTISITIYACLPNMQCTFTDVFTGSKFLLTIACFQVTELFLTSTIFLNSQAFVLSIWSTQYATRSWRISLSPLTTGPRQSAEPAFTETLGGWCYFVIIIELSCQQWWLRRFWISGLHLRKIWRFSDGASSSLKLLSVLLGSCSPSSLCTYWSYWALVSFLSLINFCYGVASAAQVMIWIP